MIVPPPFSAITGQAYRVAKNVESKSAAKVVRRFSAVSSSVRSPLAPRLPALLIRISTRPKRDWQASTIAWQFSSTVKSTENASHTPPACRAAAQVSSNFSMRRPTTRTEVPASASASAQARPIPLPPPVTIAVRPVKSNHSAGFIAHPPRCAAARLALPGIVRILPVWPR